jgi:DNA-binding transcriptional LysR family regulator
MQRFSAGLAELETLIAVVEHGGFSRAAAFLHLSQSAVTKRVGRLEADLGVRLLDRTTRAVSLTAEGQRLCGRSTLLVEQLKGALNDIRSSALSGDRIRLLATPMIASVLLPALIREFMSCNPAIKVTLRDLNIEQAVKALRSGTGDIAVMALDHAAHDLHYTPLVRSACVIVGSRMHPMIAEDSVALEQLAGLPFITVPAQTTICEGISAVFAALNVPFRPAHEANSLAAAIGMVEAGMGLTLIPEVLVPCLHPGRVSWSCLRGAGVFREFGAVSLAERAMNKPTRALHELLRSRLGARRDRPMGRLGALAAVDQATTLKEHNAQA